MADLDDLLSTLGESPLPALAPASAIQARGEQRRRRARGVVAAAGALAVVVTGTAVGLASTDRRADSLSPARPPTPSATPTHAGATPSGEPLATAPADRTGDPSSGRVWRAAQAPLTPAEASAAEQPGLDAVARQEGGPVLDPCGEGTEPVDAAPDTAEAVYGSAREAGGSSLLQRVGRFGDPDEAARVAQAYVDRVTRCPVDTTDPAGGEGWEDRYEVVLQRGDLDDGAFSALVRRVPCFSGGCTDHFAVYVLLARAGNGVAVSAYSIGEDGDPRADAESLLEAVTAKLASLAG